MTNIQVKKKRKIKKRPSRVFKPSTSKYIVLTFKTIISLLIFLFLIIAFIFFFTNDYFKISFLDCEKNKLPCSEKERNFFLDFFGENIFLFNTDKKERQIKNSYPHIREVEIEKKLPNKVLLQIKDREEFASLNRDDKSWFIFDKEGFFLKMVYEKPKNLPEIFSYHSGLNLSVGQKIDKKEILISLKILKSLKDSFILLEKIIVDKREIITLFLTNDVVASLSAQKNTPNQVDSLQFILRQSKIEGRLPLFIDLRFDKPVIRY